MPTPALLRAVKSSPTLIPPSGKTPGRKPVGNATYPYHHTNLPIQPKLTVNTPGDRYEQEADAVSEQVVQGGGQQVMRQTGAGAGMAAPPGFSDQLHAAGSGSALPEGTRRNMEQGFGADFSGVRIHTGEQAAQLNNSISARAFTLGSDIYFNQGAYAPHSAEGQRLLAHELTHTIQQSGGVQRQMIQREGGGEDKKKKADPEPKVETEVEVVTEHDVDKKETKTEATTKRSSEQELSPAVTVKASETTTGESTKGAAEVKAKDKATGLSATAGIKAESPADPMKADTATGFIKVGGQWKLFDKKLQTGFTAGLETDFSKAPKWSADWRTVFFPNGTLTPELAFGIVYGDKGVSGKIDPSLGIRLSKTLSLKAGVPIILEPGNKFNVTPGIGFTLSF
jgi:hypothetical protein